MGSENHVDQLKQGVEVWNARRAANPDIMPNLSGVDLSNTNLSGVDLSNTNLSGATLNEAFLVDATLFSATLVGASLFHTNLINADLINADLTDADLSGANLSGANLTDATLTKASLRDADLSGVDLTDADLSGADLTGARLARATLIIARLTNADLTGADFFSANLAYADLSGADLCTAALIDTRLDGANLNNAKLWETQRDGWSIKGIVCQRAFWDRKREKVTEYEDGAFERCFAENPRILLHYAGGMEPVDLAMLPLIIERLQAEHSDSSLHIRSVQDDGSGATVTITVEDRAGRSEEAFAQEIEVLRGDIVTVQKLFRKEKRLRLQAEASYRTMVRDVMPELLNRAQPRTENHFGQINGPTTIGVTAMSRDTYENHGQAGAFGSNAHAHDMTFQQVQNQATLDLPRLAEELKRLRIAMKEADDKDDQDEAVGAVAAAEKAAIKGDGPTTLQHLKAAGKWTLGIATQIGVPTAIEAIKRAM